MTSSQLRASFLDFFRSKEHTIVSSSSLLPDSPNLLFTNAGMNQFVPIFLGKKGALWNPPRTANSQKCIRAGGKHNDLEDVGLDTYHHTFFEMLGNWSFNDYFKKEAITWAWELLVEHWKFPAERLYATVYKPGEGDPAEFDQEAHDLWATLFKKAGLDPAVHIVPGNRNDNFWMMGETGPCGPCSELHVDLTPYGDTKGRLVNKGTAECIEIWNLVFIQFNANTDGTFSLLPTRHVDTGMGFERICSIMQGTKGFQEFGNVIISNYETDLFRPIFQELETMSGLRYGSTLPQPSTDGTLVPQTEQEKIDVAFRVIADHLRTLGFAIADGILPGNTDRNYVLRRILRRAVRYGRILGFREPFFYKLVPIFTNLMGEAFPELSEKEEIITKTFHREEEAFHKTLDKGLVLFESEASNQKEISGKLAFRLYDEQGFPLDLTELLARERGLNVDVAGFEQLMEEQRIRARAAQKKEIISVESFQTKEPTRFVGFDHSETEVTVLEAVSIKNRVALIFDQSVCYAEMGGQVGDQGTLTIGEKNYTISDTQKKGAIWLHFIEGTDAPELKSKGILRINTKRRAAVARHHTATHLLHYALHKVVSLEISQKGSFVGSDKLTFDFNSTPLTEEQLQKIEQLINEEIVLNFPVSSAEFSYNEIKDRADIMQFFGDKYGDRVRVVQIGGIPEALDGFSMELCGGTHVKTTGEIGSFRILSEGAVAAGVRRIEAVAGLAAHAHALYQTKLLRSLANQLQTPVSELEKKTSILLARTMSLEKNIAALHDAQAVLIAKELLTKKQSLNDISTILEKIPECDAAELQRIMTHLQKNFSGIIVLAGISGKNVSLAAFVAEPLRQKFSAGKIIQAIAPHVEGKGGGNTDVARGGGRKPEGITAALAEAHKLMID